MTPQTPEPLDILWDERTKCHSILTRIQATDYLTFISGVYSMSGGLEGQRDPLRTSTAKRIRETMVSDLRAGAVMPPIVIGVVSTPSTSTDFSAMTRETFRAYLSDQSEDHLCIIDGMQRTTALLEVSRELGFRDMSMRIECWIATNVNSLIYRMLVLNTGQVPWNLRRQIEVVFRSLLSTIQARVQGLQVLQIDDARRRSQGGQFQANELIDLYMAFGARKEKVDIREKLAEEFTRLDFIEATSFSNFTDMFYDVLESLVRLDMVLDRYKAVGDNGDARFWNGRDLFASQPACIGFMVAVASYVFGRPGAGERTPIEQAQRLAQFRGNAEALAGRLETMPPRDVGTFLAYPVLNELLGDRKTPKVGDFERSFFMRAFQVLIEEGFTVSSLTPCWRAY